MSTKKALDLNRVVERLWELKDILELTDGERHQLLDNLFATFSFEIWCISHNKNVLEHSKEIVRDLHKRVPDLWFSNGMKQNIVSLLFRVMPNTYLKLRSL